MSTFERSKVDVFRYLVAKGAPGAASVLTTLILIRVSGPEVYANYSLLTTFVVSWSALWLGWMNQAQLRYTARSQRNNNSQFFGVQSIIVRAYESIVFFVTLFGFIIYGFYWISLDESKTIDLLPILFSILGHAIYISNGAILQANLASRSILKIELIRGSLLLVLPLLLYLSFNEYFVGKISPLGKLASGFSLAICATAFYGRIEVTRAVGRTRAYSKSVVWRCIAVIRKYWNYGWPMALWLGMSTGMPVAERIILKELGSQTLFATYASFYEIVFRVFALILFPITMALHPRIMILYNERRFHESNKIILYGIGFQTLISIFAIAILLGFKSTAIGYLKLSENIIGWREILTLASAGALWQIALLVHKPLERINKTKSMMFSMLVSLSFLIIGDLYFVRVGQLYNICAVNLFCAIFYIALTSALARFHGAYSKTDEK